jgi:predicted enzyme related to lactoylglutathione lyase
LIFTPVPEDKTIKNRLHLDFRPDDQDAEVDRLLRAGAQRVDIGQESVPWVVLSDPEGNEFCVLGNRRTSTAD